jgi:hypothetical protein
MRTRCCGCEFPRTGNRRRVPLPPGGVSYISAGGSGDHTARSMGLRQSGGVTFTSSLAIVRVVARGWVTHRCERQVCAVAGLRLFQFDGRNGEQIPLSLRVLSLSGSRGAPPPSARPQSCAPSVPSNAWDFLRSLLYESKQCQFCFSRHPRRFPGLLLCHSSGGFVLVTCRTHLPSQLPQSRPAPRAHRPQVRLVKQSAPTHESHPVPSRGRTVAIVHSAADVPRLGPLGS